MTVLDPAIAFAGFTWIIISAGAFHYEMTLAFADRANIQMMINPTLSAARPTGYTNTHYTIPLLYANKAE